MGVWCDPVRNQFGENGCDYDLQTAWPGNKRISLGIAVAMKMPSPLQSPAMAKFVP
jgi:hypothetical protein